MSLTHINAEDFDRIFKEDKETCVFIFQKDSCSVCKTLTPVAEKISEEFADKIKFYTLTVTDPEVLLRFKELKLLGVPQTVFVANGEKKLALPGSISADILRKETNILLNGKKGFFGKLKSLF